MNVHAAYVYVLVIMSLLYVWLSFMLEILEFHYGQNE